MVLAVILALMITVLALFRLPFAIGRGTGPRRRMVRHRCDGGLGRGEASPAEENAEQQCCQKAREAHACR